MRKEEKYLSLWTRLPRITSLSLVQKYISLDTVRVTVNSAKLHIEVPVGN